MFALSFPRRQQYRRLRAALADGAASIALAFAAVAAAHLGEQALAVGSVLAAVVMALRARHWALLAKRSGVGARSEAEVRRVLAPLRAEGWQVRHSLVWGGRGDIDTVAIAPTGVAFAIETKTSTFSARDLARLHEVAEWLCRRRPRWCREAVPLLCVVRARGLERLEEGVLVVSADRVAAALRARARANERWALLAKGSVG